MAICPAVKPAALKSCRKNNAKFQRLLGEAALEKMLPEDLAEANF